MSRDLGRDVPDLEKLYARKLWADFSHPINSEAPLRPKRLINSKRFPWKLQHFQAKPPH